MKSLLIKDTTSRHNFVLSSSSTIYKYNSKMRNLLKPFFLIILCALFPIKLMATAQQSEKIFINGKKYDMISCPLERDRTIHEILEKIKPAKIVTNTSLWRGYIGYWSIKKNTLYLDSLQFEIEDLEAEDFVRKTIIPKNESVFSAYKDNFGIKASWFSGELRVIQGRLLMYVHKGFDNTFEKESFLTVKEGTVTHSRKVKNKEICKNTIGIRSISNAFNDAFIKEFPDIKAIAARVSYSKVNAKGKPTEVEIYSNDITEDKEKIHNFIRSYLLKNHILGVYKINNKLIFEKTSIRLGNKRNNTSNL